MIRFDIPDNAQPGNIISLAVDNNTGQRIRTLYSGDVAAGSFETEWDGRSDEGNTVSSGIYYAILRNLDLMKTINMILIK